MFKGKRLKISCGVLGPVRSGGVEWYACVGAVPALWALSVSVLSHLRPLVGRGQSLVVSGRLRRGAPSAPLTDCRAGADRWAADGGEPGAKKAALTELCPLKESFSCKKTQSAPFP